MVGHLKMSAHSKSDSGLLKTSTIHDHMINQGPLKQMDGIATKCSFFQWASGSFTKTNKDIITKFK